MKGKEKALFLPVLYYNINCKKFMDYKNEGALTIG
jgi:hypothetical protein